MTWVLAFCCLGSVWPQAIENGHMEPCLKNVGLLAEGLGVSLRQVFWDF
jgi:hypothetical protein